MEHNHIFYLVFLGLVFSAFMQDMPAMADSQPYTPYIRGVPIQFYLTGHLLGPAAMVDTLI